MESRCKCGAVVIGVSTEVHRSINCHCNMCRENHGSAFTTWVSVDAEHVSLPISASVTEYSVSENCRSYFCAQCGTKVYATDDRYTGVVALLAGTIFGIELKMPEGDYFYSDKAPWCISNSDIPKYGGTSGFEKLDNPSQES